MASPDAVQDANWLAFLREEFAPTPARWRATLRLTLVCVVGIAATMYFHIADGLYFILFLYAVNMPDAWPSYRKAWIRGASTAIGGALAIVIVITLADQPWLLIIAEGAVIAVTLFLSQTTTIPYAVILAGFTFLLLVPNLSDSPLQSLESAISRTVLITVAAVLGTITQLTLWPDDPEKQLLESLAQRFRTVAEILGRIAPSRNRSVRRDLTSTLATQLATQLDLLASAEARSRRIREHHAQQAKVITDLERLVLTALRLEQLVNLPKTPGDDSQAARIEGLRQHCLRWAQGLESNRLPMALANLPSSPPDPNVDIPSSELSETTLADLERTLHSLAKSVTCLESVNHSADHSQSLLDSIREPKAPPLLTPACSLKNVEAVRYGLKGTLAAMICYLIFHALNWPGISTCVATCMLVAQSTVGAGTSRSLLIFSGAVFGGLSAALVVMLLVPNMTGLAPFLVACGVLVFVSAWINRGSSRTSYMGIQMMLAVSLVLFVDLGPTFNLTPARDRVVGVLLGIAVMSLVDQKLWPNFAGNALRRKLAETLRTMAKLTRINAREDWDGISAAAFSVRRSISSALNLYSDWQLELAARSDSHAVDREPLLAVIHRAEEVLVALVGVCSRRQTLNSGTLSAPWPDQMSALDEAIAQRLETGSDELRSGNNPIPPEPSPTLPRSIEDWFNPVPGQTAHSSSHTLDVELVRLYGELWDSLGRLKDATRAIPRNERSKTKVSPLATQLAPA